MQTGYIVKSLKGHDVNRIYMVIAVLNSDFVLLSDGKYRKLDNPKQKRVKHVEIVSAENHIFSDDNDVKKICSQFC